MCLAIPGQVERFLERELRSALVNFSGVRKEVCLAYVPEARIGDYVIVHAGFAIARVDEEKAEHTLSELSRLHSTNTRPQ